MQDFNFYKVNETLNYKYYQIPQELFINPLYKNTLNSDSKLLYGFLLDRLSLSIKNKANKNPMKYSGRNYSNKNLKPELSHFNYSLKDCKHSYEKEFDLIKEKYNLKGQIKTVSNIACEYIITSDKEYFNSIGIDETKRYFETAYKFVCEYKNLGEQYILSAKVHMDEETPHMHLVFIPVIHTKDKKGNSIDKIACSEFGKAKDSYRQLQDAFYNYMVANNFELERGNPSERVHLSVEDYKKITNFEESKTLLQDVKLELPDTPDISSFKKLMKNRDDKIQEQIIKPKDKAIKELQEQNALLTLTLNRQMKTVDKAVKYEKK